MNSITCPVKGICIYLKPDGRCSLYDADVDKLCETCQKNHLVPMEDACGEFFERFTDEQLTDYIRFIEQIRDMWHSRELWKRDIADMVKSAGNLLFYKKCCEDIRKERLEYGYREEEGSGSA